MKSLSRSLAVVALCVAALTGCGGSGSDGGSDAKPPAKATAQAATGDLIAATDYSYVAPKGWEELKEGSVPGFDLDSGARSTKIENHFANNVNVLVIDGSAAGNPDDLDELEDAYVKELKTITNATDITARDRVDIGGEPAVHISAHQVQGKIEYRTEQYGVLRDGKSYVVTFSFNLDLPEGERSRIADSVLTTWKWQT